MAEFKLGDKVVLDPSQTGYGPTGQVIGITSYIDGSFGYVVSVYHAPEGMIKRHCVTDAEIMPLTSAAQNEENH